MSFPRVGISSTRSLPGVGTWGRGDNDQVVVMSGVGLGMSRGMGTHPLRTWDTTGYSLQVGGIHPTGMLSCLSMF